MVQEKFCGNEIDFLCHARGSSNLLRAGNFSSVSINLLLLEVYFFLILGIMILHDRCNFCEAC